ncbi:MAG: hypothetical protein H0X66_17710 [Verrucomicrobia bacterium]|nr:hypothetical protein [Verrucomicrobiota bacterium]
MESLKMAGPREHFLISNHLFTARRTLAWTWLASGLLLAGIAQGADFYAAPNGTTDGDGSIERPWNLGKALKGSEVVQPGDTIWLRGGVYRAYNRPSKYFSSLQGAENQPITVRGFPGERAIIDGNLSQLTGGWVNYWGFEIMNSLKRRVTPEGGPFPKAFWAPDGRGQTTDLTVSGFDLRAPQVKLINMIIRDSIGGGIGINAAAVNPEIYGTLSFHNGWQGGDRGHGHGLYGQSISPSVPQVRDSLFFSNYALGIQTSGTGPVVDNFQFEGNVVFFNSAISRQHQANIVVGSASGQARNISLVRNFFFETEPSGTDVNLGYIGGIQNGLVQENYFATKVFFSPNNQNVQVNNNITVDANAPGQQPNLVVVRPNQYEAGRAHIIVYNWEGLPEVTVDPSNALAAGTAYEIRNAQDILGPPITQGVYAGGTVTLPMTGLPVAKTFQKNATASTAPRFNVFVLLPQSNTGVSTNTPPMLSGITDKTTLQNKPKAGIRFRVRDAELLPDFLNISVSSSNTELVPHENIKFTGNGLSRTMKIIPAKDQVGTTIINLSLSDGLLSTNTTFKLTVNPAVAATP